MSTRPPAISSTVRRSVWAAGLMAAAFAASPVHAQEDEPSPFLPPGFGAAPAAPAAASPLDRLELRSVIKPAGGRSYVTLFDTSKGRSFSIEVDEVFEGVKVSDYQPSADGEGGSIVVESGGQSRRLTMHQAKIVAVAATPVPPPNAQPVPSVVPLPPAVAAAGPISDVEARERMQRVAEEIRRRREMRRDMLDRSPPPGAPPAQPVPPAPPR